MSKWAVVLLAVAVVGLAGLSDTVVLTDGSRITGTIIDLDSHTLYLRTAAAARLPVDIASVDTVEVGGENPQFPQGRWVSAVTRARHELAGCRLAKQGTILGGLLFVLTGYILSESLGYQAFGGLVSGLGTAIPSNDTTAPSPDCGGPLHRVEVLARIGLAYGWVY